MKLNNFQAKVTIYADMKIIISIICFLQRNYHDKNICTYQIEKPLTAKKQDA